MEVVGQDTEKDGDLAFCGFFDVDYYEGHEEDEDKQAKADNSY